ncbi:MAG: glucan 1,6-alpha-isomaltosidase [Bacteroidales bacterium]|nr:glucan 1,6-alpha-isomaltosidase [Bacteroidales bacterium]
MKIFISILLLMAISSCSSPDDVINNTENENTEIDDSIHSHSAPLYWSIYEYCYTQNQNGVADADMDFTEQQWDEVIEWVAKELKPYGYDMICTDGFIPMLAGDDDSGYMTRYGSVKLATLVEKCQKHGLQLGVYDNPLWIHADDSTPVQGTNGRVTFGDLKYRLGDKIQHKTDDLWFSWVVATHDGAKEYIDGFFRHYAEMGVEFIRMDFLSWYEDGNDRGMGIVGRGYGRECYEQALKYIAESASRYGVFTSLVMPHLNDKASIEKRYGNMVRIVADTGTGGWKHFSVDGRGAIYPNWPNCNNMFDGFVHWSEISGEGKVILDGDFTRLNTFSTDDECQSVVSLQIMAGGPIAVSDMPSTIGDRMKFYQNTELLALHRAGFVGKPLSANVNDQNSQIWYGKLNDNTWIVGLFNREDELRNRTLQLSQIGLQGAWKMRDLWLHNDLGATDGTISYDIPAHGCRIIKITK